MMMMIVKMMIIVNMMLMMMMLMMMIIIKLNVHIIYKYLDIDIDKNLSLKFTILLLQQTNRRLAKDQIFHTTIIKKDGIKKLDLLGIFFLSQNWGEWGPSHSPKKISTVHADQLRPPKIHGKIRSQKGEGMGGGLAFGSPAYKAFLFHQT